MPDSNTLIKISLLIKQNRLDEAEELLNTILSADPNDVQSLAILAEVKMLQEKLEEADTVIDMAITQEPDGPELFYMKARIAYADDRYNDAEKYLDQSIELDPHDADAFAFYANIKLQRKKFKEALDYADQALSIDPEHVLGLNMRSNALLKLNRKDESTATIEGALRNDPNNAYTHANHGWGLLEKREHKKAMEHFQQALQADPNLEFAQQGMLTALKARYFIFRIFLNYAFFMSKLGSKLQWGLIIGFYIVYRLMRSIPGLMPVAVLMVVFAFSTWVINPVMNMMLRFNKYGRFLLDKEEKLNSELVAGSFFILLLGAIFFLITKQEPFIALALFGFAMMVPCGQLFEKGRKSNTILFYTLAMTGVGLAGVITAFINGKAFNGWLVGFALMFLGFQFMANYFGIKEDNK